jgi:pilus assembly protein CpaB
VNPRQRRGVVSLTAAGLVALVVFLGVIGYVGSVRSQVGGLRPVLRLTKDVKAFEQVDPGMVETVEVPERWAPDGAFDDYDSIQGMVASADLFSGSFLQAGMVIQRPALAQGQREIAILIDAEAGVAGKVRPGSLVDIYATFPATRDRPARSEIIVSGALVIHVGALTEREKKETLDPTTVVPVTFALSVRDSLVVTYAESFATSVRLALIGGGDRTPLRGDERVFEGP